MVFGGDSIPLSEATSRHEIMLNSAEIQLVENEKLRAVKELLETKVRMKNLTEEKEKEIDLLKSQEKHWKELAKEKEI